MSTVDQMDVEDDLGGTALPSPPPPPHSFEEPKSAQTESFLGSVLHFHQVAPTSLEQGLFRFLEDEQSDAVDDRVINLKSVLGELILPKDIFLPRQIYVRDCMKTIFRYFSTDILEQDSKRVLLGSPGVGKSVLFFIAALHKALDADKPVLYVRKTREENFVSFFFMARTDTGLKVFYNQKIEKDVYVSLPAFRRESTGLFGLGLRDCIVFLDGPRHDEEKDLNAYYEYFCTSGGHPLPKNAEKDLYLWILDGWKKDEVGAFGRSVSRENEYRDAYDIFGGCIRDLKNFVVGNDRTRAREVAALGSLTERVPGSQIDLVLTTTSRLNDDDSGNPDRLRMMFNGESISQDIPSPVQIIDSQHVARLLRGRQTMESFHRALEKGKVIKSGTVVGIYFEELLHQWFKDSPPAGIDSVIDTKGQGTGREGVEKLTSKGAYWIPSIPNFANIDAAFVLNDTLYAVQYTKHHRHGFNQNSFWQDFVTVVYEKLHFDKIHVFIVGMEVVSVGLSVNFERNVKVAHGTRSSSKLVPIKCTSSNVNVVTTTVETVRASAASGFQCI